MPGSAHRYLTPNGVNISEYEYRSRKAERAGFRNYAEQRRFRETRGFRSWRFKALSQEPDVEVGSGSQIERDARTIRDQREAGASESEINDPDGPLARLLVAIGKREPGWDWPAGETPAGVKAGR